MSNCLSCPFVFIGLWQPLFFFNRWVVNQNWEPKIEEIEILLTTLFLLLINQECLCFHVKMALNHFFIGGCNCLLRNSVYLSLLIAGKNKAFSDCQFTHNHSVEYQIFVLLILYYFFSTRLLLRQLRALEVITYCKTSWPRWRSWDSSRTQFRWGTINSWESVGCRTTRPTTKRKIQIIFGV
jgi:hypothetical protein